jgi:hypothetical protein
LLQLVTTMLAIVEPRAMATTIVQRVAIVKPRVVVAIVVIEQQVLLASCPQLAWVRVWPK